MKGPAILPRRVDREQLARGRRCDDAHACDGGKGERGCRGEDWGHNLGCVVHRSGSCESDTSKLQKEGYCNITCQWHSKVWCGCVLRKGPNRVFPSLVATQHL